MLTIIFKQRWSTIPPISTKQTITSHLNSLNIKQGDHDMTLEMELLPWDRHKNVAGLSQLMGSISLFIPLKHG